MCERYGISGVSTVDQRLFTKIFTENVKKLRLTNIFIHKIRQIKCHGGCQIFLRWLNKKIFLKMQALKQARIEIFWRGFTESFARNGQAAPNALFPLRGYRQTLAML